jgi:hypothetical protein
MTARDLVGRWIHVFEEDTERGAVYRRVPADLPLSRRPRERLVFAEDGTGKVVVGGADDRLVELPASWTEKEGEVILRLERSSPNAKPEYRVVERTADQLLVRS